MSIPESKLESWANQGATTSAKNTYNSIKQSLGHFTDIDIYLQGSYRNGTNIYADSDVDVVVEQNSQIKNLNLDNNQKVLNVLDSWKSVKRSIKGALVKYYGESLIKEGKKTIKILPQSGRLNADVVVSLNYYSGIIFFAPSESRYIINFPKDHFNNGAVKNKNTNYVYKKIVRIFKNARNVLIQKNRISTKTAPSYFKELK